LSAGLSVSLALAGLLAAVLFGALRHLNILRVDQMTELAGIDNIDHGGPAYPDWAASQQQQHRRAASPVAA
jgi:Amt family ammonium transporter